MVLGRTADTGPVSKRWKGGLRGLVHPPADLRLERAATGRLPLLQAKEQGRPLPPDAKRAMNELVYVPRGDKSLLRVYDTTHHATVTSSFYARVASRPAHGSRALATGPWKSAVAARSSLRSAGG